jgi:hypothetical protein
VVNAKLTSIEIRSIECVYGLLGCILVSELAESEALWAVGFPIVDDAHIGHLTDTAEEIADVAFSCAVWKIAN